MKDATSLGLVEREISLSEPLLVGESKDGHGSDGDVSKFSKPSEQRRVHRLMSFMIGTVTGIVLQAISVSFFAKLIMFAHSHGQHVLQKTTEADGEQHYNLLLESSSGWLKVAIWSIYHLSLGIYLLIWLTMMLLAMSKVGWRCIAAGLRIPQHVTRRTCFLRTFFFINGKSFRHNQSYTWRSY